jgi:hypothetical protein
MTITLDNQLDNALQELAQQLQLPPEEVVVKAVKQFVHGKEKNGSPKNGVALQYQLQLKELVAEIQATSPNPAMIIPAQGSMTNTLAELALLPKDPDFDLAEWTQQWEAIEAEIKAINKANTLAE